MPANTEHQHSSAGMGAVRIHSSDLLPLLQSLLAILADIDFEHESDAETVRNSSADEWLKQITIRKLQERHRERRAPYVQQLTRLQKRLHAVAA